MSVFHLPDLGEGLQEAEIVSWHVSVGDRVVTDQPLVSVETDKALVEIPSPQTGQIVKLQGAPGDRVPVGSALIEFGESERAESVSVVGRLPEETGQATPPVPTGTDASDAPLARKKMTPAVREEARRRGIDLSEVKGTGPDSTIISADLSTGSDVKNNHPLQGPRRVMARAMARAGDQIVPATLTSDADISAWSSGSDPMVRLVQALSAACQQEPLLNMSYIPERETLSVNKAVELGIAVDTKYGLFVPVLRNAETLSPEDIRAQVDLLIGQTRDRSIKPSDLKDPTITLSNFGPLGGRHANLVVSPPQVAILGAGEIRDEVVVADSAAEIRPILPLSLTFDHPVITGGEAARFLAAIITHLQSKDGITL